MQVRKCLTNQKYELPANQIVECTRVTLTRKSFGVSGLSKSDVALLLRGNPTKEHMEQHLRVEGRAGDPWVA